MTQNKGIKFVVMGEGQHNALYDSATKRDTMPLDNT